MTARSPDERLDGQWSVRADLRADPTEVEDRNRLATWLEDIRITRAEVGLHDRGRSHAKRNGLAALGAWHEYAARLHKELMDRHEWCAEIRRRMAERADVRLAEERDA